MPPKTSQSIVGWSSAEAKKGGKIIIIIGETCSGDDNDNNFLEVSFQSYILRSKSKAGRRTEAEALC